MMSMYNSTEKRLQNVKWLICRKTAQILEVSAIKAWKMVCQKIKKRLQKCIRMSGLHDTVMTEWKSVS